MRDPSLPSLFGRVIWGDNGKPELSSAVPADARATAAQTGLSIPGLASFGEDAGGCLYATAGGGTVYRIVENDTRVPCLPTAPPGTGGTPTPPTGGGGTTTPPTTRSPTTRRSPPIPAGLGRIARSQRLLRNGGVVVRVRSRVTARATVGATLQIGRRKLELRRAATRARAGRTVTLKARLTPTARRQLTAALRRGAHPKVAVRVRLTAANRAPTSCASPSAPAADRIPVTFRVPQTRDFGDPTLGPPNLRVGHLLGALRSRPRRSPPLSTPRRARAT